MHGHYVCGSHLLWSLSLRTVVDNPVLLNSFGWIGPVQLDFSGAQVRETQVSGTGVGENWVFCGSWLYPCRHSTKVSTKFSTTTPWIQVREKMKNEMVTFCDAAVFYPPTQNVDQSCHQFTEQVEVIDVVDVRVHRL